MTARIDDGSHMLVSMPPSVLSPSNSAGGKVQPNIAIRIETTQMRDDLDTVGSSVHRASCCHNHMEI